MAFQIRSGSWNRGAEGKVYTFIVSANGLELVINDRDTIIIPVSSFLGEDLSSRNKLSIWEAHRISYFSPKPRNLEALSLDDKFDLIEVLSGSEFDIDPKMMSVYLAHLKPEYGVLFHVVACTPSQVAGKRKRKIRESANIETLEGVKVKVTKGSEFKKRLPAEFAGLETTVNFDSTGIRYNAISDDGSPVHYHHVDPHKSAINLRVWHAHMISLRKPPAVDLPGKRAKEIWNEYARDALKLK